MGLLKMNFITKKIDMHSENKKTQPAHEVLYISFDGSSLF